VIVGSSSTTSTEPRTGSSMFRIVAARRRRFEPGSAHSSAVQIREATRGDRRPLR
jgi:hypothetical protein